MLRILTCEHTSVITTFSSRDPKPLWGTLWSRDVMGIYMFAVLWGLGKAWRLCGVPATVTKTPALMPQHVMEAPVFIIHNLTVPTVQHLSLNHTRGKHTALSSEREEAHTISWENLASLTSLLIGPSWAALGLAFRISISDIHSTFMTPASNPLLEYATTLGRERGKAFFFIIFHLTSLFTWTAFHLKETYNDAFFISRYLVTGRQCVGFRNRCSSEREEMWILGAVKWELSLAESKMGETWSDEALLY